MKAHVDIFKTYKGLTTYYDSVQSLEKVLLKKPNEPSIEDLPSWMVLAIHISQVMLAWRTAAQAFENQQTDPDLKEYCASRTDGKSIRGPLFRPCEDHMPDTDTIDIGTGGQAMLDKIENLAQLLNLTACNWADFYNKNPLVMKYVRFLLMSQRMRKIYKTGPFANPLARPIFMHIFNEIEDMAMPDLVTAVTIPGHDSSVKAVETELHEGIAHFELEDLDKKLINCLKSLKDLVYDNGTVKSRMPEMVMDGYIKLVLVRPFV